MNIYFSLGLNEQTTEKKEAVSKTQQLHFVYGQTESFRLKILDPEEFSKRPAVTSWEAVVYGEDQKKTLCYTDDPGFNSLQIDQGILDFSVDTRTTELLEATQKQPVHGWLEVRGRNVDDIIVCCMKFRCIAKYSNIMANQESVNVDEGYAKVSWVKKMLAGEGSDSFVTKDELDSRLSGKRIVEGNENNIPLVDGCIVTHSLSDGETIVLDHSSVDENICVTMELWLTMPETAVSFTVPDVTWIEEPSFDTANTLYCVVIRWDGVKLLGNVAYTLEVS